MPALSSVIPVYNGEKTKEALCSSLIYLYGNSSRLRMVPVNDGGKNGSDHRPARYRVATDDDLQSPPEDCGKGAL